MKSKGIRPAALWALLPAVLLLLSACHIPTEPAPPSPPLRVAYRQPWPDTRNPFLDTEGGGQLLYYSQLYEPLVEAGADTRWRGRLAEDWALAADQVTWTFYLRKGVLWHDGVKFTADDVVFTYQSAKNLPAGSLAADIQEVRRVDDYTVTLKTLSPIGNLAEALLPILPAHLFADGEDALRDPTPSPVGTGPFRLAEEDWGRFARFVANDDYWAGRPGADTLLFTAYTREEAVKALAAGEVDYCPLDQALRDIPLGQGLIRRTFSSDSLVILGFNCSGGTGGNPLLADRRVRLALDQCLDYDGLVRSAPRQVQLHRSIVPGREGYAVDFLRDPGYRPRDPQAAATRLEKAGYLDRDGDGIREDKRQNPLAFTLSLPEDLRWAGEIIAQNALDIGIRLTLQTGSNALPDQPSDGAELFLYRQTGGLPDPTPVLELYTTPQPGYGSLTGYSSTEYDELAVRQQATPWPEERAALIRQAQQILYRDTPCTVLFRESGEEVYRSQGWTGWPLQADAGSPLWRWDTLLTLRPVVQSPAKSAEP